MIQKFITNPILLGMLVNYNFYDIFHGFPWDSHTHPILPSKFQINLWVEISICTGTNLKPKQLNCVLPLHSTSENRSIVNFFKSFFNPNTFYSISSFALSQLRLEGLARKTSPSMLFEPWTFYVLFSLPDNFAVNSRREHFWNFNGEYLHNKQHKFLFSIVRV